MTETLEAPEVARVRAEARAWFQAHWDPDLTLGDWWARLAESGWALPTWPKDWYGKGVSTDVAAAVAEERRAVGAYGPPSGIGVMMAGPTLVAHATDEQKRRFLPEMVSGQHVWCQLFSEPGSGSDLASLQTRAVRYGDEWIVNGQKVWTSGAQHSRWGILIARTNQDVPKHAGITYFVIDMTQPGVEVRPLREMAGGATFNEVFFTDARVPDSDRIGEVDDGWTVAVTTLANERVSLGAGAANFAGGGDLFGGSELDKRVGDLASAGGGGMMSLGMGAIFAGGGGQMVPMLAKLLGRNTDLVVRQEVARLYSLMEISRFTAMRAKAAAARGDRPGPEGSLGKLMASSVMSGLRDLGMRLAGSGGMLDGSDAPLGGMLQMMFLFSPAISIAGGTDQVQRNIIGERVLGLPPEPRVDKDLPYRELKVGTQRAS